MQRTAFIYLGHPAHYHMLKNAAAELRRSGWSIRFLVRNKDVLLDLLRADDQNDDVLLAPARRSANRILDIGREVLSRARWLYALTKRYQPAIIAGTSVESSYVGRLLRIPSIVFCEDDYQVVPYFAALAYPAATAIVAPHVCSVGPWKRKKIGYHGFQKLAYLHPNRFRPDRSRVEALFQSSARYFLLRLTALDAHHDRGVSGISVSLARELVRFLSQFGQVYISSEKPLPDDLANLRLPLGSSDVHHAIAFASMLIGDTQSMAVEAAMLGTFSIRVTDFVGRISVVEELEHRYRLTLGIKAATPATIWPALRELTRDGPIGFDRLRDVAHERRNEMLKEKIDVTPFYVDVIESVSSTRSRR